MSGTQEAIRTLFDQSLHAQRVFLAEHATDLERAVDLVAASLGGGHKLLLFGNGGSAADAQHVAAEFVGRMTGHRRPCPRSRSPLTPGAHGHRQRLWLRRRCSRARRALGRGATRRPRLPLRLSPSVPGPSRRAARSGWAIIGLTGGSGGELAGRVDVSLRVSASSLSPRIQETHILVGHVLCELVERRLCGEVA